MFIYCDRRIRKTKSVRRRPSSDGSSMNHELHRQVEIFQCFQEEFYESSMVFSAYSTATTQLYLLQSEFDLHGTTNIYYLLFSDQLNGITYENF